MVVRYQKTNIIILILSLKGFSEVEFTLTGFFLNISKWLALVDKNFENLPQISMSISSIYLMRKLILTEFTEASIKHFSSSLREIMIGFKQSALLD